MNRGIAIETITASHLLHESEWRRDELPVNRVTGAACEPPIPFSREKSKSIHATSYSSPVMASPRIAFKDKKKISLIHVREVFAVEAEGNYVVLHRASSSALLRESIATVEEKLGEYGFIRIHRSVLVNIVHVDSVEVMTSGICRVYLGNGTQYSVTRSFKRNLRRLAAVWLGVGV